MVKKLKEFSSWILFGTILIIIYKLIENYSTIFVWTAKLLSLLTPFFWGFIIAYFLNSLVKYIEKKHKLSRGLSLLVTYFLFFFTLGIFISIVAPMIVSNIMDIINKLPAFAATSQELFNKALSNQKLAELLNLEEYINANIGEFSSWGINVLNKALNSLVASIIGLTSGILRFIIGVIVSIYILFDKEKFLNSIKKFLVAMYKPEKSQKIMEFFRMCDEVFRNFFVGKAIDSLIIGILCYIGMYFMKTPYAVLLSLIVGVFNMIPYVGPFIGAAPAILITLLISPIKALWVAIFILVLQQVDGNIIGPKILGDKVGISPFYILLSITIGGGFFGIIGMLVSVPIFKVLSVILDGYLDKRIISNKSTENTQ